MLWLFYFNYKFFWGILILIVFLNFSFIDEIFGKSLKVLKNYLLYNGKFLFVVIFKNIK